jgi:hypothetical protein
MVSFASAEWQNGRSDVEIAQVITDGRNMMPAFGDTIAPAGIEALVALIRRFGGAPGPAPTGGSSSPPAPSVPPEAPPPAGSAPSTAPSVAPSPPTAP